MELIKLPEYEVFEDPYYLFACGELKVREREFLEKHHFERMLSSRGLDGFLKVLQETYYSRYVNEIEEKQSLDDIITRELSSAVKFLTERLKPEHMPVIRLLIFEEELHNIKVVIKSKILERDLSYLFIPLSAAHSYNRVRYAIDSGKYEGIDATLIPVLEYVRELLSEESDFRLLELKLELFYLENLFNAVSTVGSKAIENLLRHIIDIFNIENLCRYKFSGSKFGLKRVIYPNGFLEPDLFYRFEDGSIEEFAALMKGTIYSKIVEKGTHCLFDEQTFTPFELGEDLFYLSFFEPVKYSIASLEKIIWFFCRKKIELRSLNIIFMGYVYHVEKERIKSRILLVQ